MWSCYLHISEFGDLKCKFNFELKISLFTNSSVTHEFQHLNNGSPQHRKGLKENTDVGVTHAQEVTVKGQIKDSLKYLIWVQMIVFKKVRIFSNVIQVILSSLLFECTTYVIVYFFLIKIELLHFFYIFTSLFNIWMHFALKLNQQMATYMLISSYNRCYFYLSLQTAFKTMLPILIFQNNLT